MIERLQADGDGYNVTAPQFRFTNLDDDVARLRQVLVRQSGPGVVAGHSDGGQILTALGWPRSPHASISALRRAGTLA